MHLGFEINTIVLLKCQLCIHISFFRNISAINTAHELPTNPEEALLLWLCKVSEAVTCKGKVSKDSLKNG